MRKGPPRPGQAELSGLWNLLLIPAILLFGWTLLQSAWLSDDAYITFRVIENWLGGNGPVWNPGERIQAYTHPLWFLVLTPLRAVTGEFLYTVMTFQMMISLAAMIVLVSRGCAPWGRRVLIVLLCCTSRAFIDYSTSGLENPLSVLLFALFFFFALRRDSEKPPSPIWLGFLAGLGIMNRHDTLIVYAPLLIYELIAYVRGGLLPLSASEDSGFWHDRGRAEASGYARFRGFVGALGTGLLPFFIWEAFSIFYYGFPFPNTAYAKLNTGIPRPEMLSQGFHYLLNLIEHDPITAAVILFGVLAGLFERNGKIRAAVVSILLYVGYIHWIGGDFMAGRFFHLPYFIAIAVLSDTRLEAWPRIARWFGALILIGVAAYSTWMIKPEPPLLGRPTYVFQVGEKLPYDWKGVANERAYYYPWTGLMREEPEVRSPETHTWTEFGSMLGFKPPKVVVLGAVGFGGWGIGERTHIVDYNALTDPLLARLPALLDPPWRVGHYTRRFPPGYLASLIHDENRIEDPAIAAYYDDLILVTRRPLFEDGRFAAILKLNLNPSPGLKDPEAFQHPGKEYRAPAKRHYPAEEFELGDPVWTPEGGEAFALYWAEARHEQGLAFAPRPAVDYDVVFWLEGRELGAFLVRKAPAARDGGPPDNAGSYIRIPQRIRKRGYDTVAFYPRQNQSGRTIRQIRPMNLR